MYTVYHNPRCRKSRAGLQYLLDRGNEVRIVEYLKEGVSEKELREVLTKLDMKPEEALRKQEDIFKKELKGKSFTDDEWVKIMVENPKLIRRPIVIKGYKAVIGDPAEEIDRLG